MALPLRIVKYNKKYWYEHSVLGGVSLISSAMGYYMGHMREARLVRTMCLKDTVHDVETFATEYNNQIFLKEKKRHLSRLASEKAPFELSWDVWSKRAKETAKINYHCDINTTDDSRTVCKAYKNADEGHRLCCGGCFSNHGYLTHIPKERLTEVKALFKYSTGFWTPKGCALPRELRSIICLSHCCIPNSNRKQDIANYLKKGEIADDLFY